MKRLIYDLYYADKITREVAIQLLDKNCFYNDSHQIIFESNQFAWKKNTTFGPLRYNDFDFMIKNKISEDSLKFNRTIGLNIDVHDYNLYAFQRISYKSKFYTYFYFRLVNDDNYHSRYTGISRKKSRLGFSSGEMDFAGMGYEDDNFLFKILQIPPLHLL